jgi:formate dehydrogenase
MSVSHERLWGGPESEILECWFEGRPIREEYMIVSGRELAGAGAHSYSAGNVTGGWDEAARFTG